MKAKKPWYSVHHLIPTSVNGTNHPDNKKIISNKKHTLLHQIHDVDKPLEQVRNILDINQSCLRREVLDKLLSIIDFYGDYAYKSHCIKL